MERKPDYQGQEPSRTAFHEAGHVILFGVLGGWAEGATIIPAENYLGLAWGRLNPRRSLSERLWDRMVLSFAGRVAEEMVGDKRPLGWRGDEGMAKYSARILSERFYDGYVSTGNLLSDALSYCRTILKSRGLERLRLCADEIQTKGTVVYST